MANEFHIYRAIGVAIHIDVDQGIVTDVRNESPAFNKQMKALYEGKSIAFLKADFEAKMKPSYCNVRSTQWTEHQQRINATALTLLSIKHQLRLKPSEEVVIELNANRDKLDILLSEQQQELKAVVEMLAVTHKFTV